MLEKRTHTKNHVLFKQGDSIDGIYFISEGELVYQVRQEVYNPEMITGNWINPIILNNNQNKHMDTRAIAEFSLNEVVGFEEAMRSKILEEMAKEWEEDEINQRMPDKDQKMAELFTDASTKLRNFTCVVKSLSATVYFLKLEDFNSFYKFLPKLDVRRGVK